MEKSGSNLDGLAGDNDHDVVYFIVAAAHAELLHAQLELVASLDFSHAIDLDITVVESVVDVDLANKAVTAIKEKDGKIKTDTTTWDAAFKTALKAEVKGQTVLFFRVPSLKIPRPGVSPLRALVPFFIEEIGNYLVGKIRQ